MLNSLKNTLRLFKNQWLKLKLNTRLLVLSVLIGLTLLSNTAIAGYAPTLKEENFSAMENLVYTMVENKSTDVDFDTSKIFKYKVVHTKNGECDIIITSTGFEDIFVTLTENYQIKSLERNGIFSLLFFWILFFALFFIQGYLIAHILYAIYWVLRKIVLFFEE